MDHATARPDVPELAVVAVVRNEARHLLEWIAWHRTLGVATFYLCDNDSDDGTTELLQALHRAGVVVHIPFPDPAVGRPQMAAYEHVLTAHGQEAQWFAVIDADEFLAPAPGTDLLALLRAQAPDCGAVAVSWAVYGASGQILADDTPDAGLVVERFQRRAAEPEPVHRWVKSIVRGDAVDPRHVRRLDPHVFVLRPGFHYVQPSGRVVAVEELYRQRERAEWDRLRLNHYMVKSHQEFLGKRARGSAFGPRLRPRALFDQVRAANAVPDPPPAGQIARTRIETARLLRQAKAAGLPADWRPAPLPAHDGAPDPEVTFGWSDAEGGWVLGIVLVDPEGRPMLSEDDYWVRDPDGEHVADEIRLHPRPDVVARHPWVSLWCGQQALYRRSRPTFPCEVEVMVREEVLLRLTLPDPAGTGV